MITVSIFFYEEKNEKMERLWKNVFTFYMSPYFVLEDNIKVFMILFHETIVVYKIHIRSRKPNIITEFYPNYLIEEFKVFSFRGPGLCFEKLVEFDCYPLKV